MNQKERHNQILMKIELDGQVKVKELAKFFHVTEDCIRKDLKILDAQNLLIRVHGGAESIKENPKQFYVEDRLDSDTEEKEKIALKALSIIKPHTYIFLDISTISLEIAKKIYMQNIPITIVTNMIDIMQIFRRESRVKLIFIGGEINDGYDGFVGSLTNDMIAAYQFDQAFLGVVGIDMTSHQVSTYDLNDGLTKKQIMKHSTNNYMLVLESKFHQTGNYYYAHLDDFTGIISNHYSSRIEKLLIEHHLLIY